MMNKQQVRKGDSNSTISKEPQVESPIIDDLRKKRKRTDSGEGRLARKVPPAFQREDPYLQWFYQPHTITLLIITVLVLIYIAFNVDDSTRNPKL